MHIECDTCFYMPGIGYLLPTQLFTGHGQVGLRVASSSLYLVYWRNGVTSFKSQLLWRLLVVTKDSAKLLQNLFLN